MQTRAFIIPTHWRVRGRIEDVYDVLTTPEAFVRWWPQVYLGVSEIAAGGAGGVGRRVGLHTKGKLPYTLRWEAEVLEADRPYRMVIGARGDLDGRGEWRFSQDGELVDVDYRWTVYVSKPWMAVLAPLLRPVFVWNHLWAMRCGLEGLQRELARRGAAEPASGS